jgi:uncharacterized repeat protein (TIGR03917 family)
MTTTQPPQAEYEIEVVHGMTVAELRHALDNLPDDATFTDHYGDVDLLATFENAPTAS